MTIENAPDPVDQTPVGQQLQEPNLQQEQEPNREAAKYRRQLREAESERDALRGTVEAMQRAEVERLAGARLAKPESLWKSDVALADLIGEDGQVDVDKVAAATELAVSSLGLQVMPAHQRPEVQGAYVPSEGRYPGKPSADTATWHDLLKE